MCSVTDQMIILQPHHIPPVVCLPVTNRYTMACLLGAAAAAAIKHLAGWPSLPSLATVGPGPHDEPKFSPARFSFLPWASLARRRRRLPMTIGEDLLLFPPLPATFGWPCPWHRRRCAFRQAACRIRRRRTFDGC